MASLASESESRNVKLGLAAVVAASILFSAKSVFFKLCYRYGTPPVVLQTLRGLFSLPFYLAPMVVERFRPPARRPAAVMRRDAFILAWLGFSGYYLASILDMEGLQYISAGTERLILFVYPTLVVLFSAWIFRKAIPRSMLLPLLLSYAGIALSFGGENGAFAAHAAAGTPAGRPYLGTLLVFLSAVFYALFLVGQGRMVHRFGPQRLAAGCMISSSICVFAQFLVCYPWHALAQPAPVMWIAALTSVFCNVAPIYLYGFGVQRIGAGKAAVVSSVGPVSTLVLAGSLLGEKAGIPQLAGLALVVGGTLRLGMAKAKPESKPDATVTDPGARRVTVQSGLTSGALGSTAPAAAPVAPAANGGVTAG